MMAQDNLTRDGDEQGRLPIAYLSVYVCAPSDGLVARLPATHSWRRTHRPRNATSTKQRPEYRSGDYLALLRSQACAALLRP
jgi:hypothetical protein